MTRDEIEAERERFEAEYPLPEQARLLDYHNRAIRLETWNKRAEIARDEQAELRAEVERLRAENAALREKLTVDDLDELERYRSPLGAEPQWSASPGVSVGLAGAMIGFDVAPADGSPSRHALIRESELDQLRAAAAELAEIKRAWGMAAKDL